MKKYLLTLFNIALFLAILILIPYITGTWGLLCVSWLPAGFVFAVLEDRIDDMNRNNNQ